MLFHVSFRVEHTRLDRDQFWDEWERDTQAALGAIEAGIIKSLYKVAGQRRVIGIVEVESHDQLDQMVMGALPMSHHLTLEEVLPVREYAAFAEVRGAGSPRLGPSVPSGLGLRTQHSRSGSSFASGRKYESSRAVGRS